MIIKRGQRPPPLSEDEAPCRLLEPTKKRTKHTICHFCCPNGEEIGERERERERERDLNGQLISNKYSQYNCLIL